MVISAIIMVTHFLSKYLLTCYKFISARESVLNYKSPGQLWKISFISNETY